MNNVGKILGGIVVGVPLAAFAFFGIGDTALFGSNVAEAGYGQEKVTICHDGNTLTVGAPAVAAHVAHGDTVGPCS
jgi:hypothetical protein